MPKPEHDPGLDALLALDGVVLVVDPNGAHWVKMLVKQVAPSPERPHGISYSLTLHAANGDRLVGYDNAHAVSSGSGAGRQRSRAQDHRHGHGRTRPYSFSDAATLMQDFWNDVDAVLRERGVTT